jgi:hypothetical protein
MYLLDYFAGLSMQAQVNADPTRASVKIAEAAYADALAMIEMRKSVLKEIQEKVTKQD